MHSKTPHLFCLLLLCTTLGCTNYGTPLFTPPIVSEDACTKTKTDLICHTQVTPSLHVVIARGLKRVWVIKINTLAMPADAGERLVMAKHSEDQTIYTKNKFAEEVSTKYNNDVRAFLNGKAKAANYSGSFWQRLSAIMAQSRTRGAIGAEQWLAADPLIGTAGNGPEFVFEGVPGLSGNTPGSWTARIAAAHDADWSLGRYLNVGPLAKYLATPSAGGKAPASYDASLGLAGLGNVTCVPGKDCAWYKFNPMAVGGPYARPLQHHPDWQIIDMEAEKGSQSACITHQKKAYCWCLHTSKLTADPC